MAKHSKFIESKKNSIKNGLKNLKVVRNRTSELQNFYDVANNSLKNKSGY